MTNFSPRNDKTFGNWRIFSRLSADSKNRIRRHMPKETPVFFSRRTITYFDDFSEIVRQFRKNGGNLPPRGKIRAEKTVTVGTIRRSANFWKKRFPGYRQKSKHLRQFPTAFQEKRKKCVFFRKSSMTDRRKYSTDDKMMINWRRRVVNRRIDEQTNGKREQKPISRDCKNMKCTSLCFQKTFDKERMSLIRKNETAGGLSAVYII